MERISRTETPKTGAPERSRGLKRLKEIALLPFDVAGAVAIGVVWALTEGRD